MKADILNGDIIIRQKKQVEKYLKLVGLTITNQNNRPKIQSSKS